MPSVVRLNRKDLIEWIEAKEADGGDATALRRDLEALHQVRIGVHLVSFDTLSALLWATY